MKNAGNSQLPNRSWRLCLGDAGLSMIMIVIMIVLLISLLGLVVDSVIATTTRRQLVLASEQAALTAAQRLVKRAVEVERSVLEGSDSDDVAYRDLLLEVEGEANGVAELGRILGRTGEAAPLGHLKLKLADCSAAWCQGDLNQGGTLEPGRWYRREDGAPPAGQGVDGCSAAGDLPCFVPLRESDVPEGEAVPITGANAFRVTTALRSPLQFVFAQVFSAAQWRLTGMATAWIAPMNSVFMLDLSPSIHRDTHLRRSVRDPVSGAFVPGLKSEFAFRDKDVDPSCKRFCPNQIQADPFYAQMFGTMGMIDAAAVGFLDIIGAVMSNDTMRSLSDPVCQDETATEHPFPDDRICPVFKAGDYTTCMTNYCDYQGLADAGCDLSRSVLHCKNDYQPLNVSVGGFSSGTIDQQKMYVDLSAAPGSSYVRGAEPLFSILNGIHYAARVFRRWGKGDQIGLLAFDWELFPDAANKLSRIFLLSQDYTALIEATDPKVTPAKAADSAKSSLFSRFLFSRGTVQPNNEIYPLGDWNDVTDMQPAMDRTFELLDNAQVPNTKSFAMLFTDGLPNCTGSAAEPVSNRCLTVEYYWRLAVERLFSAGSTGGVPHYAEKRMPVHVVLYDVEVGAHTLNLTTSDTATADCMRDRIARLNQLPYTYDDCASQEYLDVIDDTFHTAHEMLGQAGACGDLTIGEPHMRGVGYISTGNFLGFLFDPPALEALNEYMSCCAQEANVSACMVGFLTALECKDPCCALYAATTLLGASRYYKNQVFYGPNDAFYRVAKETGGLWAPLREPDPAVPLNQPTLRAYEGALRQCTKAVPGAADPFNGAAPQRQIYDPWGRSKRTQVLDAVDAVLQDVPILLVQ